MTIQPALIITCDCPQGECPPFASSSTNKNVARKQAAHEGWVHRPADETDWHPAHILIKENL